MKSKQEIHPLPFPFYFWPVVVITGVGLLDSLYLASSHYRVYTDIAYESFCAISRAINCDTVSQSDYAILWHVPLAVWGMLGYLAFLVLLVAAFRKPKPGVSLFPTLFLISLGFSILSILLALVSSILVKSYCIMCIVSYGVNLALLFYTHLVYKRFGGGSLVQGIRQDVELSWLSKRSALFVLIMGMIAIGLILLYPKYWHIQPPNINQDVPTGLTESGHPWMGAENPEVVIVEFADYQCFQCRKMHYFLRQLVSKYPDRLRIIHRHFPMDNEVNPIVPRPFHVGSGKLSLMAIYALEKGRFWEMNDLLYSLEIEKGSISYKELSEKTGLDEQGLANSWHDHDLHQKLWQDIREGIMRGMTGTPGYVIDDKLHVGGIPPATIKQIIRER